MQRHSPAWLVWTLPLTLGCLALAPMVLPAGAPLHLWALWMTGPAYLLHQIEEHRGDRFRRYVNDVVLAGQPGLSPQGVFWINVPLVWGGVGSAMVAGLWHPGWGLFAPWLLVINGVLHAAVAIARRAYNPGLVTGVLVFLPLGLVAICGGFDPLAQAVGFGLALAAHMGIVLAVRRALRR